MRWQIIFLVIALSILLSHGVYSLNSGMCATAKVTSINPSSIDADEDFTVGIEIDNCGEDLPENITFQITLLSTDISVKEPLVQNIGKMGYANSKRFITYHMHSSPDAIPGEHLFKTKLVYGGNYFSIEKEDNFSITINSKKPDLMVSRVSTNPEIIKLGDTFVLTIDIENAGEGDAKDVRVKLNNLPISGSKLIYLGQIKSDENIPGRFILTADKSGLYSSELEIQYKANGEIKNLNFPFEINVIKKDYSLYFLFAGILIVILAFYLIFKHKISK
jgi:hypothetical protein